MTAKTKKTKTLPKEVRQFLELNVTFNIYGIVSLSGLRTSTKTDLSDAELKRLIKKEYGSQFGDEQGGGIEFLSKEHTKKATRP